MWDRVARGDGVWQRSLSAQDAAQSGAYACSRQAWKRRRRCPEECVNEGRSCLKTHQMSYVRVPKSRLQSVSVNVHEFSLVLSRIEANSVARRSALRIN